jgi:hypothetical protein
MAPVSTMSRTDAPTSMSLGRHEMAVRLAMSGEISRPFTLRTLPPSPIEDQGVAAAARASALARYGRDRHAIDDELEASLGKEIPPEDAGSWDR